MKTKKDIHLPGEDIKKVNSRGVIIVPAVFVNDKLYSYGDLEEDKFLERLELNRVAN